MMFFLIIIVETYSLRLITLFSFPLSYIDIALISAVALCIGMAKTGVHGAGMVAVPLLATVFGGKLSSGVLLPMLVFADLIGVRYYNQHASWKHLKKLFPWAAVGVLCGTLAGSYIDDKLFKMIMATIIIISVGIMIWLEKGGKEKVPSGSAFAVTTGIAGGFTSMVGNLAGSVMAIYLLAMRFPKNAYIGTTAWFFLVTNWFKVPFHLFVWHTVTLNTVLLDVLTIPIIGLGAYVGILIVKSIPDKWYRWFIIATTLVAALVMLL
jgi:uncharacterized membrane protein YfcA